MAHRKALINIRADIDENVELMLAGVGQDRGVVFFAVPVSSSRWKQEPKKRPFGLSPMGCELQVSSDPTALGPGQEKSVRSNRKTSGSEKVLRGQLAQVEETGTQRER